MNTIVKCTDKTYGGYNFIEYNWEKKVYHTGTSRSFRGHYKGGGAIVVNVSTLREIKNVQKELELMGFTETNREN